MDAQDDSSPADDFPTAPPSDPPTAPAGETPGPEEGVASRPSVSGRNLRRSLADRHRAKPQSRWPILLAVASGLVGLVFVVLIVLEGSPRVVTLWVCNGLDVPYDARVGAVSVTIAPGDFEQVRLAMEGESLDVSIAPIGSAVLFTPSTLTIDARQLRGHTLVVNPDRVAVLAREEAIYGSPPLGTPPPAPTSFHYGALLHEVDRVGFIGWFPEKMRAQPGISHSLESRIIVVDGLPLHRLAAVMVSSAPDDAERLARLFRDRSAWRPADPEPLEILTQLVAPEGVRELLEPGLEARPVRVGWHERWQDAVTLLEPERDLGAEYRALLEQSPDDGDLAYLTARVSRDPGEIERLVGRAVSGATPSPHAENARGRRLLRVGRFEEALERLERAAAAVPENADFRDDANEALAALGRTAEVIEREKEHVAAMPIDDERTGAQVRRLVALGMDEEAESVWGDLYAGLRGLWLTEPPASEFVYFRRLHALHLAEAKRDRDAFVEAARALAEVGDDDAAWKLAVIQGDGATVEELLGPYAMAEWLLLGHAVAARAGDGPRARRLLEQAIAAFAERDRGERELARLLRGEARPSVESIVALPLELDTLRIALVTIGLADPEVREAAFAHARLLNAAALAFPHLVIDELTH